MRVILVDDESLIRMDMRSLLEAAGHEVVGEGTNGVEAIALANKQAADVLLMDVKMPKLDGIEAARQIRRLQKLPVVLLTAYSQEDLIEKAQESGVYGYLIKPVRENQVIPTLQMAIGRFKEDKKLNDTFYELKQELEERKLVPKATGILMSLYQLTEEEAYKRIRTFSMNKGKSIADVCQGIIASADKKSKS